MSDRPPTTAPVAVRLRELRRRDLKAVSAIEAEQNADPWSRQLFACELDRTGNDRHWLVASAARAVVGFGGVMYGAEEAHMLNLAVAPIWTRQGIGRRLCVALLAEAWRRTVTGFTLEVRTSNAEAQALYRSLGFEPAGIRPRYYPDGEDAVIMWLHDLSPFAAPSWPGPFPPS
jgi:[ribosomal protein S18]-alanine N-acetyltransferase